MQRPPEHAMIRFEIKDAAIKWVKRNGVAHPVALVTNGRELPFVKEGKRWGFRLPMRQMAEVAPDFATKTQKVVADLALARIQTLVQGDVTARRTFVESVKGLRLEDDLARKKREHDKSSRSRTKTSGTKKGKSRFQSRGKASGTNRGKSRSQSQAKTSGTKSSSSALAGSTRTGGAVDTATSRALSASMGRAYEQMLDSSAFFFPREQPGGGDPRYKPQPKFSSDEAENQPGDGPSDPGGGGTSDDADADEDEEDQGSWLQVLGIIVVVVVALVAPVAAAIWLAAQAITLATVATAILGSIGAFTAANLFLATCVTVEALVDFDFEMKWTHETFTWTNDDPDVLYLMSLEEGDTVSEEFMDRHFHSIDRGGDED